MSEKDDIHSEQIANQAERASNQAERASIQAEQADAAVGDRAAVQADAVETVKVNLQAAIEAETDRRRHAENERLGWRVFSILLLFLNILQFAYFRSYIHDGRKITSNTNHLVQEIDAALSPASQAKSDDVLKNTVDDLVLQINNGNVALCTRIVGALESKKILPPGTISSCSVP